MCHHTRDLTGERWEPAEPVEEEADEAKDEEPSFLQEERDVDVELLEADDD